MAKIPRSQCSRVLVREVDPKLQLEVRAAATKIDSCKTQCRQINKQNKHKINAKKENRDHTKSRKLKKQ